MDRKRSFISYLASEHSLDYWSDLGIDYAIELADGLLETDWVELREGWTFLEPIVQVRLAEVVSELSTKGPDIIPMLLSMLSSETEGVVVASLDSLNSICHQSPEQIDIQQLRCVLEDFAPTTDSVVAKLLDSLKQKVS